MRRGDLVTIVMAGDVGKPRPALVIQSDIFDGTRTITVLLISGTLVDTPFARLTVQPTPDNGLRQPSQVMVDKAMTVRREKVGAVFGRVDDDALIAINRLMALFFGLA